MNRRAATRITLGAAAGLLLLLVGLDLASPQLTRNGWSVTAHAASSSDKLSARLTSTDNAEPDNPEKTFTIRSESRLVLLDAAVVDSHGNFVSGLAQKDFRIQENGKPQPITAFESQDAPVTMGILVDESISMAPIRAQVLAAAQALIKESNPRDEVFVLNFNDTVRRGLPPRLLFSDNINQLREALYLGRANGRTALYDAIDAGLAQLKLGKQGVKTLVVISDGGDTASRHKRQETLDLVERSTATIFSIGLVDDPSESGGGDVDPSFLRRISAISGGEALFPRTTKEVAEECRRVAQDVRARYTVGYKPPEETDGHDDPLRHLRISVPGKSGLKVLARTSYRYADSQ